MTVETSGRTIPNWLDNSNGTIYPALDRDLSVDVCIIGGGITGLTTAYLLSKENKTVVLIEDGTIGSGETGRTTAHLSNALDDHYSVLEKLHGKDGARLAADSHTAAINEIERIVKTENIDCDFLRLNGYLFLAVDDTKKSLVDELEAAHRSGLTQVALLEHCPITSLSTGPCLQFPEQGQFHPVKYIHQLSKAITQNNGSIYEHTQATKVSEGEPVVIETSTGHKITAQSIVIATNAPILDHAFTFARMEPSRTYAIVAQVPKDSIPLGLYWDTADPYHYVRLQAENDVFDLLIIGGEDHRTGEKHNADEAFIRLEAWSNVHFPQIQTVTYKWSGQVLEPADYLAFIGRSSDKHKNCYIATGDSGHGMTHGTIAGMLLRDLITGRENPWTKLYDPQRSSLKNIKNLVGTNMAGSVGYTSYFSGGEVSSVDEIKPGEGAVIREGLHKHAVYRDEAGTVHKFTAVCPHMKAILEWNSTEKSWDCPAHGSRFAACGELLNGPANCGLSKVK